MSLSFNGRLAAIGIRVVAPAAKRLADSFEADIERTLLDGLEEFDTTSRDGRLIGLLFSWIKVHGEFVICEKLGTLALKREEERPGSTLFLPALAALPISEGLHKWKALGRRRKSPVYLYPEEVARGAIKLKGRIPWLAALNYHAAVGSIRIRESDVMSPAELIRANRQYRNRYLYGPSWRADIVTAVEEGARSPMEVARRTGCSYEPAHRVFRQLTLAGIQSVPS